MALIKCSECGKEISDRAITCPNCGCPNVAKNHCIINGTDVDCSFIFDKSRPRNKSINYGGKYQLRF